jgi:hypothetical protein
MNEIKRPVTAPYSGEVHTAAWEAWDEFVAKLAAEGFTEEPNILVRKAFMDGFVKGLQS